MVQKTRPCQSDLLDWCYTEKRHDQASGGTSCGTAPSAVRRTALGAFSGYRKLYLQRTPQNEPIDQFMDKKSFEGKSTGLHDGLCQHVPAHLLRLGTAY